MNIEHGAAGQQGRGLRGSRLPWARSGAGAYPGACEGWNGKSCFSCSVSLCWGPDVNCGGNCGMLQPPTASREILTWRIPRQRRGPMGPVSVKLPAADGNHAGRRRYRALTAKMALGQQQDRASQSRQEQATNSNGFHISSPHQVLISSCLVRPDRKQAACQKKGAQVIDNSALRKGAKRQFGAMGGQRRARLSQSSQPTVVKRLIFPISAPLELPPGAGVRPRQQHGIKGDQQVQDSQHDDHGGLPMSAKALGKGCVCQVPGIQRGPDRDHRPDHPPGTGGPNRGQNVRRNCDEEKENAPRHDLYGSVCFHGRCLLRARLHSIMSRLRRASGSALAAVPKSEHMH